MLANKVMLSLPNALVNRGAGVDFVDKWGDRGAYGLPMAPKIYGLMIHWIVSKKNGKPKQTLGVVTNGHSTLAGPLANLHQDWDGRFTIVAGGRANHGGLGIWRGVSGNQYWIAVECEGPPFEQVQIDELAKLVAAVADVTGQDPEDWAIDHAMYAPSRKIDCKPYIAEIRAKGIALYRGTNKPEQPSKDKDPKPDPQPPVVVDEKEDADMFIIQDHRYGSFWVIPADMTSKVFLHPDDRSAVINAYKEIGVKVAAFDMSADTIDRIPDPAGHVNVRVDPKK